MIGSRVGIYRVALKVAISTMIRIRLCSMRETNNCKELSILPEDEDRFSRRGRTEYIRKKVTELNISSRGSRVESASIFGP